MRPRKIIHRTISYGTPTLYTWVETSPAEMAAWTWPQVMLVAIVIWAFGTVVSRTLDEASGIAGSNR